VFKFHLEILMGSLRAGAKQVCGRENQPFSSALIMLSYTTPCPPLQKKTCDYIFCNNFNNTCPITIIFVIVSGKSMCHRKVVSFPTSPI